MQIVKVVDAGRVTEIRCQFSECKRRPRLRYLYYCSNGKIVGSSCAKKVGGNIPKLRRTLKTRKRGKQNNPENWKPNLVQTLGTKGKYWVCQTCGHTNINDIFFCENKECRTRNIETYG